jgi:hypothetical protein
VANRIEWQNAAAEQLPEDMLRGAELLFGVTFSTDYRECVRVNHGGHPEPRDFIVRDITGSWGTCLAVLLSFDWRQPVNVWSVMANLAVDSQLPDGLFPIAEDGGGDLLCLDFAVAGKPRQSCTGHTRLGAMKGWSRSRAPSPIC